MNSLPGNDHAAVSKFCTEGLHEWQEREGETDATCIALALDANTEATLALAFEQRTANETLNRIADALERLHV
ncbi:MAG: hypothetical protein L0K67_14680 [Brevibacterium sp.]|nr:hypothetical protein [Brevibacterium sp.]